MLSGNDIVSYYFGIMLEQAGVIDSTTQLEINIILNAWCLVSSIIGTMMSDKLGRKTLAAISTGLLTVFIFIVGGLTKVYGNSISQAGVYVTVASIFLFQGAYSFGWTPLTLLYPPEVLNYSIRSVGMAWYTFWVNGVGLMVTFSFPSALEAIGWKTYMINGAWDVLELVVVLVTWVETRGRTLEENDENLDVPQNVFIDAATKSKYVGRAIFITGGNRGFGKVIATSFARAGASFIGLGAPDGFGNVKQEFEAAARNAVRDDVPTVLLHHLDITDSDSGEQAAEQESKGFGKLYVLINNAGFMTPALSVVESDGCFWWRTSDVNLKGVHLVTRSFVPLMMKTGARLKIMVNIISVASHNLRVNESAYGTSKWAVLKLTEFLLVELAHDGLLAY
ncbi:hypothetical protein LTR10_024326 [Elasticomyces elasticus]|uniref:Major facilitator superfamily (MFS) profile domain-containing protein n=1 Tax=Exophiala sideris TaxID=1016849 RepID=A0ABR0IVQ0_9EURO|nr:hypothetical protein LTR10_024326 [Elasticomyces elasticus]KAK5020795.1 hypothetical protein LTS07_011431 [Exophiala sideris]KAK5022979.1 hypothetical protein LTR13_011380 [Exophiala sideris]KAK5048383.1 hypothetical protein LTR69_011422 [Exophiala sideris]KAK5175983.1 hypothetical protein LTR44_011460 [Eurotiomycetes sp. CCFEE 6388]